MNIALYSATMQAGKSTVAEYLVNQHYFIQIKFARILKNMLAVFLVNFVDDPWQYLEGDKKEVVIPEINVTARYLMQTLGTEWGRFINLDTWVIATLNNLDPNKNYVIDDLRFENEYRRLRELGFVMVKLVGRGTLTNQHQSEGNLDGFPFDYLIENDGTIDELLDKIDAILET